MKTDVIWYSHIFLFTPEKTSVADQAKWHPNVEAWMEEQGMEFPKFRRADRYVSVDCAFIKNRRSDHMICEVFFKSEEDATLFKLKWQ